MSIAEVTPTRTPQRTPGLSWAEAGKRLAQSLPGYEDRPDQTRLASAIEDSLASEKPLMANAPTGVGKSLAGLIPAIAHARAVGKPVIISTETKALQGQYIDKELPWIKEHIYDDLVFVKLMGRSNYLCWQSASANDVDATVRAIQEEAESRHEDPLFFGELESFSTDVNYTERPLLTVTAGDCLSKKCAFYERCLPNKAKAYAKHADVIVVNHSLLIADALLRLKGISILPEHSGLIIDEAHELESVATSALSESINERTFTSLVSDLNKFFAQDRSDIGQRIEELSSTAIKIFLAVKGAFSSQQKYAKATDPVRLSAVALERFGLTELMNDLFVGLLEVLGTIDSVPTGGDPEAVLQKTKLANRVSNVADRLNIILSSAKKGYVAWIDGTQFRDSYGNTSLRLSIKYSPLSVAPMLSEALWQEEKSVVLMSATLAIGDDFAFIAERIGLQDYTTLSAGTPFDFMNQAATLFVQGANPTGEGKTKWQSECIATTSALVEASGGRALLLFTSRSEMENAYRTLSPSFTDMGLRCLKQSPDVRVKDLASAFINDETSVLFGLRSFMTGFSAEGDTCRLVILNKLPFASPDDVVSAARVEEMDRVQGRWTGFNKLTVPMTALVLMQAFGRLIRTKRDRGVFVLIDERIHTKSYGRKFLKGLPQCEQLASVAEAKRKLASYAR